MGERMRSTNGKFNMPDLSKKTVNQLVSVTAKNWTSAPTGSTEWTKTWKDTLAEEYTDLYPTHFNFIPSTMIFIILIRVCFLFL